MAMMTPSAVAPSKLWHTTGRTARPLGHTIIGMTARRRPDADLLTLRARKLFWLARRPRRWPLLRRGVAPSIEHSDLFAGRRFTTVIDIGANLGQFALWAADTLGASRIVCVEPLPESGARLAELAEFIRPCQLDVLNCALGSAAGTMPLHMTVASDSSSLLPPVPSAAVGALKEVGTHAVQVCVGDDVLPGPFAGTLLVKIDVQGFELDVLAGIPRLLTAADAVLVEVSFAALYEGQADASAVVAHLLAAGFSLTAVARVPGASRAWGLEQADLLFEKR